ncbi:MAG: class I mannose-6-phosphate isomerase [Ruminococcus sp.]|nr:class I mannose-6-phosphate isomerase [Ruminococcus sp.]
MFGKRGDSDKIAESWELAANPDGSSIILWEGKKITLSQFLATYGTVFLGTHCAGSDALSVLIKLIDAKMDLSIQVHPDDAYAKRVEHGTGKSELWYILDATPDAFLYCGVNRAVTREELEQRIQNHTLPEILRRVTPVPGMSYYIPAGTIHAIGGGVLLAEIQQNSNITYRVYDYDRRDAAGNLRELHIQKALETAQLAPQPLMRPFPMTPVSGGTVQLLQKCSYFSTQVVTVTSSVVGMADETSFRHLLMLSGSGTLNGENDTISLQKGDSLLIPAGYGSYHVTGSCRYLETWKD